MTYENFQGKLSVADWPKGKFSPLGITEYGTKGCVHVCAKKLKHNSISSYIYSALLNYLLKVIFNNFWQ